MTYLEMRNLGVFWLPLYFMVWQHSSWGSPTHHLFALFRPRQSYFPALLTIIFQTKSCCGFFRKLSEIAPKTFIIGQVQCSGSNLCHWTTPPTGQFCLHNLENQGEKEKWKLISRDCEKKFWGRVMCQQYIFYGWMHLRPAKWFLLYRNNFCLLVNETISGRPGLLWDTSLSFEASSSPFVDLMPDMRGVNAMKMSLTNATNVTTHSRQEDLSFEWTLNCIRTY